jgi:tubulin alpha
MERIRYMIGKSENIEGILIFNSIGGGTGSGVASLLAEFFSVSYPKLNMFYHTIMDSRA